jgi:aminoglycoside phosphotransferase (APT) family kinase protein
MAALLSGSWPDVRLVEPPRPLSGGFWASMHRLRVKGQPAGVPDDLVLRIAPDRGMGAKETAVQRTVASQGFPTPAVWLSGQDLASGDGSWSVMTFSHGAPLLAGLDGAAVVRRVPALLRDLPAQLATTMASLHRLDPAPVTAAVAAAAPAVAWSATDVLAQLELGAKAVERDDLVDALAVLADGQPDQPEVVLCHGDLHPFNVLTDGDQLTVLDWTGAVVADPCFDLALTELLLANPPLSLPRPLMPALRAGARLLARRFVSAYAAANPAASLDALDWYRGLHEARVLVDVTRLRAEHGAAAGGHPWGLVAPAVARDLSARTGVALSQPG